MFFQQAKSLLLARMTLALALLLCLGLNLGLCSPSAQAATLLTVTNENDSGSGSLRAALTQANATAGEVEIQFNVQSYQPYIKISPNSPLPDITNLAGVFINGYSQPGASIGDPHVQLDGANAPTATGLLLRGGVTVSGLRITRFETGIAAAGSNKIEGNFIGLGPWDEKAGNKVGVRILGNVPVPTVPGPTTIGGVNLSQRNVISGNTTGIASEYVSPNTSIVNNFIGLSSQGNYAIGNVTGVSLIFAPATLIANTISGNVTGLNAVQSNLAVISNSFGSDAAVNYGIANQQAIKLGAGSQASIDGNVIGGNVRGILLTDNASARITSNLIGVRNDGKSWLGNQDYGIFINSTSPSIVIGGKAPSASGSYANVIANNKVGIATAKNAAINKVFISRNTFFENANGAIDLDNDGLKLTAPVSNSGVVPPTITSATLNGSVLTTIGTAAPNATVELFHAYATRTGQAQGDEFYGTTQADANGNWQISVGLSAWSPSLYRGVGSRVTATQIANGSTSEFAASTEVK